MNTPPSRSGPSAGLYWGAFLILLCCFNAREAAAQQNCSPGCFCTNEQEGVYTLRSRRGAQCDVAYAGLGGFILSQEAVLQITAHSARVVSGTVVMTFPKGGTSLKTIHLGAIPVPFTGDMQLGFNQQFLEVKSKSFSRITVKGRDVEYNQRIGFHADGRFAYLVRDDGSWQGCACSSTQCPKQAPDYWLLIILGALFVTRRRFLRQRIKR